MRHWVKYVRWDVIQRWRTGSDGGEHVFPFAYGSRDPAFPGIRGGTLWLVSAPRYGRYRMPPSLIARLHITDVVPRDDARVRDVHPEVLHAGPWIGLAERDSTAYLPLNNANRVLHELRFQGRTDRLPPEAPRSALATWPGPYSHLGGYFQRHRVLTPDSVDMLQDYAEAVWKGRRVFLSYRWRDDFTDDWLRELTNTLVASTVSCWWDRWDVPQQDLERIEKLLRDVLEDAIHQSAFLVALMRPGYLESAPNPNELTWVRREWNWAGEEGERHRRHRMTRVAVVFGDQPASRDWIEPGRDIVLAVPYGISAGDLARRLISLLPS
jgi:hypothetical protein